MTPRPYWKAWLMPQAAPGSATDPTRSCRRSIVVSVVFSPPPKEVMMTRGTAYQLATDRAAPAFSVWSSEVEAKIMFTRCPRSRPSFASSSTPDDRVSAVAFFALRAARISTALALASLRASPAETLWSSSFQAAAWILSPVIRRTCLWKSGASVRAAVS